MRIWSLHPKYIDAKGLVALWRESLLAKHVLEGKTKGYKNHPQLQRFKECDQTLDAINYYLVKVCDEADKRHYHFDRNKIEIVKPLQLEVTRGQLEYEQKHLLNKLLVRNLKRYEKLKQETEIKPHPIFKIVDGDIENWEIINTKNYD